MSGINIKRFIKSLLFIIFIIYVLVKGMEWERHLKLLTRITYNPYPHLLFLSIFPPIIGMLLALPDFITKARKQGLWYINWVILISMGIPTFYVAISPALYFSPISNYLPPIGNLTFIYSQTPQIICGVIFGYVLLSVFDKRDNQ